MTTMPPPSTTSDGIVTDRLRRSFGDVHAVVDVSFSAEPGQVTALVGPNGSGKTTLLLMLASLLRPDGGTMSVGGFDPLTQQPAVRKRLGWMPDALGAWPSLTARETLVTTARMYRMPRDAAAARADELLSLVRLKSLADKPARVFSRGQKQRLGLARALVHDPSVLLLDEPASGLDPQARIELRLLLRALAAEGRTILISSHVLSELDEVADTAVFMQEGRTVGADRLAESRSAVRSWRLRLVDLPGAAIDETLRAAGVSPDAVTSDRDGVVLAFASERDAAATLAAIVATGALVAEFAPTTGRFEQTFLDLNSGDAS